jgi:hypothetical protein
MISLNQKMNSLFFSKQLNELKEILDEAEVKITFWGGRVIEVGGFTGSFYLKEAILKLSQASSQRWRAKDLLPSEEITGKAIAKKMKDLYQISNIQIQNSNLITRIMNFFREFSFDYSSLFIIDEIIMYNFTRPRKLIFPQPDPTSKVQIDWDPIEVDEE